MPEKAVLQMDQFDGPGPVRQRVTMEPGDSVSDSFSREFVMPTYRFEFCHHLRMKDHVEVELDSDAEAQREAMRAAAEHLIDSTLEGIRPDDWAVRICNESGELLWTIDFSMLPLPAATSGEEQC